MAAMVCDTALVPKRPRSEGSTLVKEVNPLQRPRDSMRPGTSWVALIILILPFQGFESSGPFQDS
jgi:hypothetical protein